MKKFLSLLLLSFLVLVPRTMAATSEGFTGEGRGKAYDLFETGGINEGGLKAIEGEVYGESDTGVRSLPETVMLIISVFLTILGTVFLIITIYAGFRWMTAGGN
jgi:hypothetical protein